MRSWADASAPRTPLRQLVARWAPTACLVFAGLIFATGAWIGVIGYAATPIYDQWQWTLPDEILAHVFAPHNEHRIVVSRLIFLVDAWLFRATGIFSTVMVYAFEVAHAALLYVLARAAFAIDTRWRRALLMLAISAMFFSGFQFENFTSGFQNQFTGVFLFASLMFVGLAHYKRTGAPWSLAGAAMAGVVAVLTMANGLLAVALAPVAGLALRLKWRDIAVLAVVAVGCWALYFLGYARAPGHSSPLDELAHPVKVFGFILGYLGGAAPNSLDALVGPLAWKGPLAMTWGALGLACAAALVWFAWRTRDASPMRVAAAAIVTFVVASAAVTALGRASMEPFVMLSNRYGAATAPFWVILAAAGIGLSTGWRGRSVAVAVIIVALVIGLAQKHWLGTGLEYAYRKRETGVALISGVHAPAILGAGHPDPELVWNRGALLKPLGYAMYAEPWSRGLGRSIPMGARLAACDGAFLTPAPVPTALTPAWRVGFQSAAAPAGTRAFAFTDAGGVIIGYGVRHMRNDRARPWPLSKRHAVPLWSGFASGASAVSAVALDTQGRALCRSVGVVQLL